MTTVTTTTGNKPSRAGVLWYIRALMRRHGIKLSEIVEDIVDDKAEPE